MTDTDRDRLDGHAVEAELLADWRVMFSALHARFRTGDFATGLGPRQRDRRRRPRPRTTIPTSTSPTRW